MATRSGAGRLGTALCVAIVGFGMSCCLGGGIARAASPLAQGAGALAADGNPYLVSTFAIKYNIRNSALPGESELMSVPIRIGMIGDVYVVPGDLESTWKKVGNSAGDFLPRADRTVTLSQLSGPVTHTFYGSAIWAIDQQLRQYLNDRKQLLGVYVAPPNDEIDKEFIDQRKGAKRLDLVIYAGIVREVHTVGATGGSAQGAEEQKRLDQPAHEGIRLNSPVKSFNENPAKSLLRRDLLDDYISQLDRHPGRHVDVAVSAYAAGAPGEVVLNYLVAETKPWSLYAQVSNTGTKNTSDWREAFGYINNQVTHHDDIFSLNYSTAGFTNSHSVDLSYDAPLPNLQRLRYRVYGTYDRFTASDVGFNALSFTGEDYQVGGELAFNFYHDRNRFIDLVAGARYQHVLVENGGPSGTTGNGDFGIPYMGLRYEQLSDIASLTGSVTMSGWLSGASQTALNRLGRLDADRDAPVLQGNLSQSFFLEPLLFPKHFAAARTTLAHEIVLGIRGQTSFGSRLIPDAQQVAGGLYSVRGYPESIAAGDSVVIGTAEYRFHFPRTLISFTEKPGEQPGTAPMDRSFLGKNAFKYGPQQPFGHPDWDLIFRGFVDAGETINSRKETFEADQTLVGAGIGAELDLPFAFPVGKNLSLSPTMIVRVDWGIALNGVTATSETTRVRPGSNRLHFSATLLF